MKKLSITLITTDLELHKQITATSVFDTVDVKNSINDDIESDVIIISDRLVKYNDLAEKIQHSKIKSESSKWFYMLSSDITRIDAIKNILESKGIEIIPPKHTVSQICEKICRSVGATTVINKNVFSFFGADSKVGLSMVVQSLAENLAKNTKASVCVLNLSGQPNYNYFTEPSEGRGLDHIKAKLFNDILSVEELIGACHEKDNLYILPAANNMSDLRFFNSTHVESLVTLAASKFDIVLIDAGFNPINSGLYVGALNVTTNRYLVTSQNESSRKHFECVSDQILHIMGIEPADFMLIVNKYQLYSEMLHTSSQLAEMYKSNFAGQIKFSPFGLQAEIEKRTIIELDSEYESDISLISKVLAHQVNYSYTESIKKKSGFSLFNR